MSIGASYACQVQENSPSPRHADRPAGSTRESARGARETRTLWPHVRVSRSDSMPSPKRTRDSEPTTRLSSSSSSKMPSVCSMPV